LSRTLLGLVDLTSFRKPTKTKGVFANENSLLKLLCAGMLQASERWALPIQNWNLTLSQL